MNDADKTVTLSNARTAAERRAARKMERAIAAAAAAKAADTVSPLDVMLALDALGDPKMVWPVDSILAQRALLVGRPTPEYGQRDALNGIADLMRHGFAEVVVSGESTSARLTKAGREFVAGIVR